MYGTVVMYLIVRNRVSVVLDFYSSRNKPHFKLVIFIITPIVHGHSYTQGSMARLRERARYDFPIFPLPPTKIPLKLSDCWKNLKCSICYSGSVDDLPVSVPQIYTNENVLNIVFKMVWNLFATTETKILFRSSIYYKIKWLKEYKCNKEENLIRAKFYKCH